MEHLPSMWLWVIEMFAPLIATVLLRPQWDGRIKQVIAFVFSMALGVLAMWIEGTLADVFASGNLPVVLSAILGEAEVFYKQVWSPLITTAVEKRATVELKDVLYVQKATPVITAAATPGLGAPESKHDCV